MLERVLDLSSPVSGEISQMLLCRLEEPPENDRLSSVFTFSPPPTSSRFRPQRFHFQSFPSVCLPKSLSSPHVRLSGSLSVSPSLRRQEGLKRSRIPGRRVRVAPVNQDG